MQRKLVKNKTLRSIVLDFVQANGPQPYSALHNVVLIAAGQPLTRKSYGSSILDQVSYGSACLSNKNDYRRLEKQVDGLYHIVMD